MHSAIVGRMWQLWWLLYRCMRFLLFTYYFHAQCLDVFLNQHDGALTCCLFWKDYMKCRGLRRLLSVSDLKQVKLVVWLGGLVLSWSSKYQQGNIRKPAKTHRISVDSAWNENEDEGHALPSMEVLVKMFEKAMTMLGLCTYLQVFYGIWIWSDFIELGSLSKDVWIWMQVTGEHTHSARLCGT